MMRHRIAAAALAVTLLVPVVAPRPAWADNQMGYHLLSAQQASALARRGGAMGVDVSAGQTISDSGLTFTLLRVTALRNGSPGAAAGLHVGDQIIAADGRVFPSVPAFASYVASVSPGQQILLDYMPNGAGPQGAQRVAVTAGGAQRGGLSTGQRVAIGVGAAALLGCYEMGCFNRGGTQGQPQGQPQPQPQQ